MSVFVFRNDVMKNVYMLLILGLGYWEIQCRHVRIDNTQSLVSTLHFNPYYPFIPLIKLAYFA